MWSACTCSYRYHCTLTDNGMVSLPSMVIIMNSVQSKLGIGLAGNMVVLVYPQGSSCCSSYKHTDSG